jgi:uncharacterized RmlC-like cupin family protein
MGQGDRRPMSRRRLFTALAGLALLAALAAAALQTGFARKLFHEVYERVAGVELLGPPAVRIPPTDSPYQRWLAAAQASVPLHDAWQIPDVSTAPLRPWPEQGEGVNGLYLQLAHDHVSDARILEIPPRGETYFERHLYEKGIYFLGGPGHTEFRRPGAGSQRVDWQEGSLLSIPLNVEYRHVNDADAPVRLLAVTTFPFVLNSFASERFIEDNPFEFTDRYDAADDYFERGESPHPEWLTTNFVPDIRRSQTVGQELRGAGNQVMHWTMAGNSMLSLHVSEIPPQRYKKAHRHSNGSVFLLLSGQGYTLTWPAGGWEQRRRVDWQAGTLFAPPAYWYHQHLNTSAEPARYLSINTPDLLLNLGLRFTDQVETRQPELREAFERELERARQNER